MNEAVKLAPGTDLRHRNHDLARFWWLYLPLGFFCMRYLVHLFTDRRSGLEYWFRNELGIVENLTVFILLIVVGLCLRIMIVYRHQIDWPLRSFLVVYCLGAIYFAGEEASWGQHWFGWETGEFFLRVNDQQETNFHNTTPWLDRIPKGFLSLAIFIGGILMPLWFCCRQRRIDYGRKMWWLCPTLVCLPSAVIATIATWPSKIERNTDWQFYFDQAQETKELYIAGFLLLFVLSLGVRLSYLVEQRRKFSPS